MQTKLTNEEMEPINSDSPPINKVTPANQVIFLHIWDLLNITKGRSNKKQSE